MRAVSGWSVVVIVAVISGCNLSPVPRLSSIERKDESGARTETSFEYDDAGHIVGVEKVSEDDGTEQIERWTLTWEDRGAFNGTPLVRVEYENEFDGDVVREVDIALENDAEARKLTAKDDESGDKVVVDFTGGDIVSIVSETDDATTTTTFKYELGNLTRIDAEVDSDEGDDSESSISISYLDDDQENIGGFEFKQDDNESTIDFSYDDEGRLNEQQLRTTLADDREVLAINSFDYDEEGRVSDVEHRGSVDDGAEVVIGDSTFSYDDGDVTGVEPTPGSLYFVAPLFSLKGSSSDNLSSSAAETFVIPTW